MNINLNNDNNDYVRGYKDGKIAGATAENDRAQLLVDALEALKEGAENHTIHFIDKILKQWKSGKGKELENPCPNKEALLTNFNTHKHECK